MTLEKGLTERIVALTQKINERYPELSKYITELPIAMPDEKNPDINVKNLNDYYDSLVEILKKYKPTHVSSEKENQKK